MHSTSLLVLHENLADRNMSTLAVIPRQGWEVELLVTGE